MAAPEPGTKEYQDQVNRIVTVGKNSDIDFSNKRESSNFLMMFVMDMSFHRAAICEALKILEQNECQK